MRLIFIKISFVFLYISIFTSCSSSQREKNLATEKDSTIVYDSISVNYSKRFSIKYCKGYKIIYVFGNRNNSDTTYTYVLYERGIQKPSIKSKAQFIQIPVNRVASLSSLYTGCLEKLNLRDKIVAVDDADFICDSSILSKVTKGEIKEVSKGTGNINIEQTLLIRPELIITCGMGNPDKDINQQIIHSGIPIAISVEHLETSPLAGAEWIKFFACFFNAEKKADSIFDNIVKRYTDLTRQTEKLTNRPSVLTEMKYGDTWFVPGGKSFMAEMLKDAGANYIWKDDENFGSLQLSVEEVFNKSINTDYWLNLLFCNTKKDIESQDNRYTEIKAFKTGKLYNNNARLNKKGGNAYWETGLMSPDEVLADMIFIFHSDLLPEHQLKYYQQLK